MGFQNMPEPSLAWGYPAILLVMMAIGVVMFFYFRGKKWL